MCGLVAKFLLHHSVQADFGICRLATLSVSTSAEVMALVVGKYNAVLWLNSLPIWKTFICDTTESKCLGVSWFFVMTLIS